MHKLIPITLLLFATSCAPVYVPNLRNSPMFTKGGEFQVSGHIGNGIEGQSAFSVTNHIGVIASYAYINEAKSDNGSEYHHRHRMVEGGAGYFANFDDMFVEVFAGYGRGMGASYDSYEFFGSDPFVATGKYERWFLQPALGVNRETVEFSFASRISMVDFYSFSTSNTETRVNEPPKFFFEPAAIGRINFANNHMMFMFQVGASMPLSEDVYFDLRNFQSSIGLGFRVGAARKLVSRL